MLVEDPGIYPALGLNSPPIPGLSAASELRIAQQTLNAQLHYAIYYFVRAGLFRKSPAPTSRGKKLFRQYNVIYYHHLTYLCKVYIL